MATNDGRSDEDLMEAHYAGDDAAFGELDRRHREPLTRRAFYRLPFDMPGQSRRAVAEGLAETALANAAVSRDKPSCRWQRQKGPVRPWLNRILANVIVNYHREETRRRKHERNAPDTTPENPDVKGSGVPDAVEEPDAAPDRQLEKKEVKRALRACLDRLPEHLRSIVHDYFWEEMTLEEIAVEEGVSPATVHRRLKEAQRLLGECLHQKKFDTVD